MRKTLKTAVLSTVTAIAGFFGYRAFQQSPPPQITTTLLTLGVTGRSYSMPLSAVGGRTPYKWRATGLPFGLSMSGSNLVGTLNQPFEGGITFTVTDKTNKSATVTLPLAVCKPLIILNPPTKPIPAGGKYQFFADGGPATADPPKCNPPQTSPL